MTKIINEKFKDLQNERLQKLRNEKGLTQKKLAEELGISFDTIRHYESDRTIPTELLVKIAEYFKTSTDYLLGLNDVRSLNITDTAINKETGLSEKAIQICHAIKGTKKMEIINFLIEQEEFELFGGFSPITRSEYSKKQNENLLKYEEEKYDQKLEKVYNNCIPILNLVTNYFSIKDNEEELYLLKGYLKRLTDFEFRFDKYLAEETLSTNEILENSLLEKIKNQLVNAKNKFCKGENKN